MKITATDVVLVAKNAGFEGNQLRIAVAVSFAEDLSHETTARGRKGEIGLWQIYPKASPQFASQNLDDPFANARAAFEISQHQPKHWNYWTTWPNAAALRMPDAAATIAIVERWDNGKFNDERVNLANKIALNDPSLHTSKLGNPPPIGDINNPLTTINNAIKFLSVGRTWARIGQILIGGAIVLIAVNTLTKPYTEPVRKVARTAAKATPTGEALGAFAAWK
jgi:hypothetical protein